MKIMLQKIVGAQMRGQLRSIAAITGIAGGRAELLNIINRAGELSITERKVLGKYFRRVKWN
jgi:hypothetical protein